LFSTHYHNNKMDNHENIRGKTIETAVEKNCLF
jgi:hypothetical protein